jgi:hypothetical protein
MAYRIAPPEGSTVLGDPNDPALGNSYADGVERAKRVKAKKKKLEDPTWVDPASVLNSDEEGVIRSLTGASEGSSFTRKNVDDILRLQENIDISNVGFSPLSQGDERAFALDLVKKRKTANTVLGG